MKKSLLANYIGIIPPDIKTLKKRLYFRATESPEIIEKRIETGIIETEEIKESDRFSYKIINDDLETAYSEFKNGILNLYPLIENKMI